MSLGLRSTWHNLPVAISADPAVLSHSPVTFASGRATSVWLDVCLLSEGAYRESESGLRLRLGLPPFLDQSVLTWSKPKAHNITIRPSTTFQIVMTES